MRDPLFMRVRQRVGNLLGIGENLIRRKGIAHGVHRSDVFFEGAAGEIFRHGEGLGTGSADIEKCGDVRMFQQKKLAGIFDFKGVK